METCQVSLNLDQLTVWYMKGWLAIKPDQKTIFFVQINFFYFWTSHFVIFESKHSFKLCKLHLPKENSCAQLVRRFIPPFV